MHLDVPSGSFESHHVVVQRVYLGGVLLAQDLVVLVFGGQGVVDVQGVVLFGRSLHGILQLVLGIGIILSKEGGEVEVEVGGRKTQLDQQQQLGEGTSAGLEFIFDQKRSLSPIKHQSGRF